MSMTGDEPGRDQDAGPGEGDATENGAGLSEKEVFDALQSERRQAVLRHLDATGDSASLDELETAVDTGEGPAGDPASRRGVDVRLHHVHLPKLDHAGVVDYDCAKKTVRLREGFEPVFEVRSFVGDR
jgi:hypothetical protein